MYINVVGLVAGSQIGLLDRYSKEGFKRQPHWTLDGAITNVILKTFASLSIIISSWNQFVLFVGNIIVRKLNSIQSG